MQQHPSLHAAIIWHGEDELVPLAGCHVCKTHARVATRWFHLRTVVWARELGNDDDRDLVKVVSYHIISSYQHGGFRRDEPACFCVFNHVECDAILDAVVLMVLMVDTVLQPL